ncbi:MAG: hypothetical protein O2854_09330, partial [Chloroflexi bacterium]|nr:hypothetical protein [Chloroflexota bacterium]
TPEMADPDNYPVRIEVPEGPVTVDGTRRNARMLIEYLEGWIAGRGAKGIDSLAGRPGLHGPLMEDLATGRMSTAQIAQRIIHEAKDTESGRPHSYALVKQLLQEQTEDIIRLSKAEIQDSDVSAATEVRYRKAYKIALRWVKNYTELDFRSLGSYTRADLEAIAAGPEAF